MQEHSYEHVNTPQVRLQWWGAVANATGEASVEVHSVAFTVPQEAPHTLAGNVPGRGGGLAPHHDTHRHTSCVDP